MSDDFATEAIQLADRNDDLSFELVIEVCQFEGHAAEATELIS